MPHHYHVHFYDAFKEEQHPRGQPDNPGQFVKGSGKKIKQLYGVTPKVNEKNVLKIHKDIEELIKSKSPKDVVIRDIAKAVAKHLKYKKIDKIRVLPEAYKFTLNGKEHKATGAANLDTGEILLYLDSRLEPVEVASVIAHEVMHQKFEKVYRMFLKAEKTIFSYPEREKDFPIVKRFRKLYEAQGVDSLIADDGLTKYSKDYWTEWHKKTSKSKFRAVHETLAEMSRLDWEGLLKSGKWYKDSRCFKPLYELVNEFY